MPEGPSRPTVALASLLAVCIPLDPLPLLSGRTIGFPFILLLILSVTADHLAGRRSPAPPPTFYAILTAYLCWIVSSYFWSFAPEDSFGTAAQLAIKAAMLISLSFVIPLHWRKLTGGYLIGALALAIWILAAGNEEYAGRHTILGADENALGMSLAVAFALVLVRLSERRAASFVVALGLVGIIAAAILATGSRTGFVAMVTVVLIRIFGGRQKRQRIQLAVTLAGLSVVALVLWRLGRVPERVGALIVGGEVSDDRVSITSLYFDHPSWMLLGTGIKGDARYLELMTGQFAYVHNLYIGTWVQLGIVGLVILIAMLASVVAQAWRSERRDLWLAAASPVFIYTLTLNVQTTSVYWFVVALGVAGGPAYSAIQRTETRKAVNARA